MRCTPSSSWPTPKWTSHSAEGSGACLDFEEHFVTNSIAALCGKALNPERQGVLGRFAVTVRPKHEVTACMLCGWLWASLAAAERWNYPSHLCVQTPLSEENTSSMPKYHQVQVSGWSLQHWCPIQRQGYHSCSSPEQCHLQAQHSPTVARPALDKQPLTQNIYDLWT